MSMVDVIKHETSTASLVDKVAIKDIKLGSQLIVYPSQTAFFVKGGKIYDEFTSGTYTIKSENIPLLGSLINLPFGGNTPFAADVWFVNQISLLDNKWGTISPIQIEDPQYHVIVPVRGYGQYGYRISNPRAFLERFVGNMKTFSASKFEEYFRAVILSHLTNIIASALIQEKIPILEINAHVLPISDFAKSRLEAVFAEYGVELLMFNVISISVKEDDPSFVRLKEIKDTQAKIAILGREDYRMSRSFDVLDAAAANPGGGAIGAAVGIGAGVGIGAQVVNLAGQTLGGITTPNAIPPIPASTTQYYLAINGNPTGPFDLDAVKQMFADKRIAPDTLAWKSPMTAWKPVSEFPEFTTFIHNCPPPLPL